MVRVHIGSSRHSVATRHLGATSDVNWWQAACHSRIHHHLNNVQPALGFERTMGVVGPPSAQGNRNAIPHRTCEIEIVAIWWHTYVWRLLKAYADTVEAKEFSSIPSLYPTLRTATPIEGPPARRILLRNRER